MATASHVQEAGSTGASPGSVRVPTPVGQPATTPQSATITPAAERRLRETLRRLRHELQVEFAARLNDARAFGEIANNDEYLQIREEAGVLASKIARLERVLRSARVVDERGAVGVNAAAIGTTVVVEDLSGRRVSELDLVGDYETAEPHAVSASSPIGRSLLGRTAGSEVEVELPDGRSRRLHVLSVRPRG